MLGVEAIALRQPMLNGSRFPKFHGRNGTIAPAKLRGPT
jgi:hypothetical protein